MNKEHLNNLVKDIKETYPLDGTTFVLFLNPNYVGTVLEFGEFNDEKSLSKLLEDVYSYMSEEEPEYKDNFDICWLDIFKKI